MKQIIGAALAAALVPAAALADPLYRSAVITSGGSNAYQIVTTKDTPVTVGDSVPGAFSESGTARTGSDYEKAKASFSGSGVIGNGGSVMSSGRTIVTLTPTLTATTTTHFLVDASLSLSGYTTVAAAQAIENGVDPNALTFYGPTIPTTVFSIGALLQYDWSLRDLTTGTSTTASIYAVVGQRILAYKQIDNKIFYSIEAPFALGRYMTSVGGSSTTTYFGNPGGGQQLPGGGDTSNPGGGNAGGQLPPRMPSVVPYFSANAIGLDDKDFGLAVTYTLGHSYQLDMQLSCEADGVSRSSTVVTGIASLCDASQSAYWNGVTGSLPTDFALVGTNGQNYVYSSRLSPHPLVLASGTPEPGQWLLMIGGFGAVGSAARRRRGDRMIDIGRALA